MHKSISNSKVLEGSGLLLTISQSAAYLQVSESTIRRLIKQGDLSAFKHKRRYYLSKEVLDPFLPKPDRPSFWKRIRAMCEDVLKRVLAMELADVVNFSLAKEVMHQILHFINDFWDFF